MSNIRFKLGFDLDKKGIQQARTELTQLMNVLKQDPNFKIDDDLQRAYKSAEILQKSLRKAYNTDFNKLNTKEFNRELTKANTSVTKIEKQLNAVGVQGGKAFNRLEYEMNKMGLSVKQNNKLLNEMFDTFGKTVKWGIASSAMNQLTGSIQRAVGFTKSLDESLNNIRVVSGKSAQEMKEFASEANDAAKALGKTTTEYTDASLIFFQQGKAADEVRKLTEATLLGANVTGTEVSEMADLLTAVMNGYNYEASRALEITDKLAAVGAGTGADFEELAKGMSKVASMASTTGVEIDQLNAMLATVSTVTREAPESIGTSFKTIFGNISEVKAGKETEDGWTLGKVDKTIKMATEGQISVLGKEGEMRDVQDILTDIGNMWTSFNRESQMAIANAMAGKRQMNRLIALYNNWDMYQDALEMSQESLGATMDQNTVRMDSLSYQSKQLKANLEQMWMNLFSGDDLKGGVSALNGILDKVNAFIEVLGGGKQVLMGLGATAALVFSKQIGGSILGAQEKMRDSLRDFKKMSEIRKSDKLPTPESRAAAAGQEDFLESESYEFAQQNRMNEMSKKELTIKQNLTAEEHARYQALMKTVGKEDEALTKAKKRLEYAESLVGDDMDITKKNVEKEQRKQQGVVSELRGEREVAFQRELNALKTSENATTVNKAQLLAKMDAQQDKTRIKIIQSMQESKNGNISIAELENKINLELDERVSKLRTLNQLQEEGLDNIAEEAQQIENQNAQRTGAAREEMDELERRANREQRMQSMISIASGAAIAIGGVTAAWRAYGEAAGDVDKENAAILTGTTSLGGALMMMPGLWTKVAGAVVMAAGAAGTFIRSNFGITGMLKDNANALEDYKNKMAELKEGSKLLKNALTKMNEAEELASDGLDSGELEQYNAILNEVAESTPTAVAYYDAFGDAVLKSREEVEKMNEALKEQMNLESKRMSGKSGNFATELAYLQTEGDKRKGELQAEIQSIEAKIDSMYVEGASQKRIDKKQKSLDKLYSEMDGLQKRYSELGQTAQDALVGPFIASEEIFKELGKELQGYTTSLFNSENIMKGIHEIKNTGEMTTKELKKAATDYIESYKSGVLEVASAFDKLKTKAEGDKNAKAALNKVQSAPEDVQQKVGTQLLALGIELDDNQLMGEIEKISKYINEKGEVDSFGLLRYFRKVGEEAKRSIQLGVEEAFNAVSQGLVEKDVDFIVGQLKRIPETIRDFTTGSVVANPLFAEAEEAVKALQTGNMELFQSIYEGNEEIRQHIREAIEILAIDNWDFGMDNEEAARNQLNLEKLDILDQEIEKRQQIISSLAEENSLYDENIALLYQTAEGQEEIATLWNDMVAASSEVGEGGLFSVNIESMEDARDALMEALVAKGENVEANKELKESNEDLMSSTRAVGEAFLTMADDMGQEKFAQLAEMAGVSIDKLQELAQAAKNGNIDAAKSLQSEMGKIYGAMRANDAAYFQHFVKINNDRLGIIRQVTGIEADDFKTLADYQTALEQWKADNVGQYMQWQVKTVQEALGVQVQSMGEAASITMEYNGKQLDAAGRAAAIASLITARGAVEAASKGSEGGVAAARNMIDALAAVDSGMGATLSGIKGKLAEKGATFASVLAYIDGEIAKLSAGGDSAADNFNLSGISLPSFGGGFNYSPPSGAISTKPGGSGNKPTSGSAGPQVGGGGGKPDKGGKGDKDKKEKEVEDLEWEEDIYHDINIQLEQKSTLLKRLKDQQDKLYGKELLDNLAKQKKALQEQQALLEKKLQMQKQDLANQKKDLSGKGVTFNADGTISNYNKLLSEKVKYVNSLSGEAKEAAKEEFDALVGMMEKYEDLLMNAITSSEDAIQESIDAQREIFLQEFEYKITVQMELSKDFQDALGFLKDVNKEFEDSSENYDRTVAQLGQKLGELGAIQEHLEKIKNDGSLTDKERIEMLSKYSKTLKDAVKEAKKLFEELDKIASGALKDGLDTLKEQDDKFKSIDKQIKHIRNTLKLIGEEGNHEFIGKIYDAELENLGNQLDLLMQQKAALQAQRDTFEVGSKEWHMFNNELIKTEESINKITEDLLKTLQEDFKNTFDGIMDSLESSISGGLGLDKLKKEMKELKDERKKYLDVEEKITSIGELQNKLQEEMNKTDDPKKLAALQKFKDEELKKLKDKDKLTKYDVDRANLLYDITLKQMALEDQRNAKNQMRLVRDEQGNWIMEFTEDAAAVEEARNDLSDSLKKLQELDKKNLEELQDELLDLKTEYVKELQDIVNAQMKGEYENDAAFKAALQAAHEKFAEKQKNVTDRYEEAKINATTSSMATILDAYNKNKGDLGILAKEEEEIIKQMAEAMGGDYTKLQELMTALNSGNEKDFKEMAESMGIDANKLEGTINKVIGNMEIEWGLGISDMISDNKRFEESSQKAIDNILDSWNKYKDKVNQVTSATGTSLDGLGGKLDEVVKGTKDVAKSTEELIKTFNKEMEAVAAAMKEFAKLESSYDKVINKTIEYIKKLDELIKKQKEQATGVTTPSDPVKPPAVTTPPKPTAPTPTPPPTTGGSGTGSGSGSTTPLSIGTKVKVKSGRRWYYDSAGMNPSGKTDPYSDQQLQITAHSKNGSHPYNVGKTTGNYLGWLKKEDLVGFDTGGYTGSWGKEGKMAMLHEKEIVLNKDDTSNILEAVSIMRGGTSELASTISNAIAASSESLIRKLSSFAQTRNSDLFNAGSKELKQEIVINADFSGVKSSHEIEKAFENMSNMASQYAYRD